MKRRQFTAGLVASGIAAPQVSAQAQLTTPGVYVTELGSFSNAVVPVETGVPAFVGYTETALYNGKDLTGEPTQVTSITEYELMFGGAPMTKFGLSASGPAIQPDTRFLMHQSLRIFFANGGGPCWIVSVGGYATDGIATVKSALHFQGVWPALATQSEPAIVVVPDAVLLSVDDHATVSNAALEHCVTLQSRVAILDVRDGAKARSLDGADVISGTDGFRTRINAENLSFGTVYYPWLNTSITGIGDIDYRNLSPDARTALRDRISAELPGQIADLLQALTDPNDTNADTTHKSLLAISKVYQNVMTDMLATLNLMPPSAAMAGIYARTDANDGVFTPPANTGIEGVVSLTVPISQQQQEDLNAPLDGKAVNAIRTFTGRGVVVWGARTLDGNDPDWRYISVRRTMIMLEQSIKLAIQSFVFAANDTATWAAVQSMIESFLTNQWKQGALVGNKPEAAFGVQVGLGSTMTKQDIQDGNMRVMVSVAMVHPVEFIVINFTQQMAA